MAGIRDSISSSFAPKINFTNLILRGLQLIFAVTAVGFYASMYHSAFNNSLTTSRDNTLQTKLSLAVGAGSLSIITAIAFALIPALISYYYVAIAFPWELIVFFIWCGVFGWFKSTFGGLPDNFGPDIRKLGQFVWIDLINLLLWLATASMSVFCLLHDRQSLRRGDSAA